MLFLQSAFYNKLAIKDKRSVTDDTCCIPYARDTSQKSCIKKQSLGWLLMCKFGSHKSKFIWGFVHNLKEYIVATRKRMSCHIHHSRSNLKWYDTHATHVSRTFWWMDTPLDKKSDWASIYSKKPRVWLFTKKQYETQQTLMIHQRRLHYTLLVRLKVRLFMVGKQAALLEQHWY